MITIDVYDFDQKTRIGEMTLDETKIPKTTDFVFSFDGIAVPSVNGYIDLKLYSIFLLSDKDCIESIEKLAKEGVHQ